MPRAGRIGHRHGPVAQHHGIGDGLGHAGQRVVGGHHVDEKQITQWCLLQPGHVGCDVGNANRQVSPA